MRLFITAAAMLAAGSAYAFPPAGTPVTSPLILTGNGQEASAIFAFRDAADQSNLNLITPAFGFIFDNQAATPGDTVNVGPVTGNAVFQLENNTTGIDFTNDTADSDGNYHFFATTDYSDFGVGALDPAVAAAIAALPTGTNYIFVGTEDRVGGDFDYNDIIWVFTQLEADIEVPTPGALAIFGLGLAGLGLARRRG